MPPKANPSISPDAVWISRQQAAALASVGVKLVDKLTKDNPQVRRLKLPGRGKACPAWSVRINRADFERYIERWGQQ